MRGGGKSESHRNCNHYLEESTPAQNLAGLLHPPLVSPFRHILAADSEKLRGKRPGKGEKRLVSIRTASKGVLYFKCYALRRPANGKDIAMFPGSRQGFDAAAVEVKEAASLHIGLQDKLPLRFVFTGIDFRLRPDENAAALA